MSEETTQKGPQKRPEDRFQDAFQGIERAIIRWSKVRGPFDALLIQAAEETLHLRVQQGAARFDTTDQITLFKSLEARAAEMRDHRNFTRSIPPAMLEDLPDLHTTICRALMEALHNQPPADPFVVADLFSSTSLPAAASDRFCDAFYDLLPRLDNIVRAKDPQGGNPLTYIKLANAPEPGKLASPPEPEP